MAEYLDRITDKLSSIPGYDAYRDKENRRDTDRRVRDQIGSRLAEFAARIERIAENLAARREIEAVGPVDSAATSLRHVQNLVQTATYGYGGIFSDRDVNQAALDQLTQFDEDILTRSDALEPAIAQLESASSEQDRSAAAASLQAVIDGLKSRFDGRAFVIETGRPADPESLTSPLSVLEPADTKPSAPAVMRVKRGDALAISGTNLLVDAVIDISGPQPMKLFRVALAPERWLIVNERFVADAVRQDMVVAENAATVDGEALPKLDGGSAKAVVSGMSGDSGERAVSYQVYGGTTSTGRIAVMLSWDSASLSLVGRGLAFDDIEIYGQPSLG